MLKDVLLRLLSALHTRLGDDDGQTLAEYAMIVSVVAVATIVIAVVGMRDTIATAIETAADCIKGSC